MSTLDGCRALIERAHAHRQALNAEIRSFLGGQPYEVRGDRDPVTREGILRFKVAREPPLEWSIRTGEIIHDIHTALDHLVFGLTELEQGNAPAPLPRKWRDILFPIVSRADLYTDSANRRLWGLALADRAIIDAVEPYHEGKGEHLWLLRELSNISKHRHLVAIYAMLESRSQFLPSIVPYDAIIEESRIVAPQRLSDDDELARLRVRAIGPNPRVEVQHNFTFDIALNESEALLGWNLDMISLLLVLTVDVSAMIERFQARLT